MARLVLLLVLTAAFACTSPRKDLVEADAGCLACPDGLVCSLDAGSCATALSLAAPCGAPPDGGASEGLCATGLSCVSVGSGVQRCAQSCASQSSCGQGLACFAQVGASSGAPGYCASQASAGQACDSAALVFCNGDNLTCVTASADQTAGQCFEYCDPRKAEPNPECAAGQSCAGLFPDDPSLGICVAPAGTYPRQCNYASLAFCGNGQLCVRPTTQAYGYCHTRCSKDSDCTDGERCLTPAAGISICVAPVARCAADDAACPSCGGEQDAYCAPEDLCVSLGQARVCKADCTAGEDCPANTACAAVGASGSSVCL